MEKRMNEIMKVMEKNNNEEELKKEMIELQKSIEGIDMKTMNIENNEVRRAVRRYSTCMRMLSEKCENESMMKMGVEIVQSMMDRGVRREELNIEKNSKFMMQQKEYLRKRRQEYVGMNKKEKRIYVTIWEVYTDINPEDVEMLLWLENMGYYN